MPDAAASSTDAEQPVSTDYARADAEEYGANEMREATAALRPGDHIELTVSWLAEPGNVDQHETFHANVTEWTDHALALEVNETGRHVPPVSGEWTFARGVAHTTGSDAAFDVTNLWRWPADSPSYTDEGRTFVTADGVAHQRLRTLSGLFPEVALRYTGRQLIVEEVDPSSIAMLATTIPTQDGPAEPFTLPVAADQVGAALDELGRHDSYTLAVDGPGADAVLRHGTEGCTISQVEPHTPSSAEEIAWPPDLEGAQSSVVDAAELYGALASSSQAAAALDSGAVHVSTTEQGLVVAADGADASHTVVADVTPGDESQYTASYLRSALGTLPATGRAAVQLGEDYPLALMYDDAAFSIAPRIVKEGGS